MKQPTIDNKKHRVPSFSMPLFLIGFGIPRL